MAAQRRHEIAQSRASRPRKSELLAGACALAAHVVDKTSRGAELFRTRGTRSGGPSDRLASTGEGDNEGDGDRDGDGESEAETESDGAGDADTVEEFHRVEAADAFQRAPVKLRSTEPMVLPEESRTGTREMAGTAAASRPAAGDQAPRRTHAPFADPFLTARRQ